MSMMIGVREVIYEWYGILQAGPGAPQTRLKHARPQDGFEALRGRYVM